jgi:hypothetical protein
MKNNIKVKYLFPLLTLILNVSCGNDQVHCDNATNNMISQTFDGTISLCNAQPPDSKYLGATATINSISSNQISIHLVSDSSFIDTILYYKIDCNVFESNIPVIDLFDNSGTEIGSYSQSPDRISFRFGYTNCLNNTSFEGHAN